MHRRAEKEKEKKTKKKFNEKSVPKSTFFSGKGSSDLKVAFSRSLPVMQFQSHRILPSV